MLRNSVALLLVLTIFVSLVPMKVHGTGTLVEEPMVMTAEEQEIAEPEADSRGESVRAPEDYFLTREESVVQIKGELREGATEGSCGDGVFWKYLPDEQELIISGNGKISDYSVNDPAPWVKVREEIVKLTVEEGVTYIGEYAFYSCHKLADVSLPESLVAIEYCGFQYCYALKEITFPEGLEKISYGVFNMAGLQAIHLPSTIKIIGGMPFYGCTELNEITLPESNPYFFLQDGVLYNVEKAEMVLCPANRTEHLVVPDGIVYLREEALAHCVALEGLTLPDGIKWHYNAFTFCRGLLNIYVSDTNEEYQSLDGVLYSKDLKTIVQFPVGRSGSYAVREGTVEVGYGAFCRMENEIHIMLPDSVEIIRISAFSYSTGLRELKLSANIVEIYAHAFNKCTNMRDVILPDTLTLLGYDSFSNCKSITEIVIPGGVEKVPQTCFQNCSELRNVVIKEGITSIGIYAFSECKKLETVSFPEGLENISAMAFYRCESLYSADLPSTLVSVGQQAFYRNKLTKVVIPEGVEVISKDAFGVNRELREIILPRGLRTIEHSAFEYAAIEEIVIPETVEYIGSGVFYECDNLRYIHFMGPTPEIIDSTLDEEEERFIFCYIEGAAGWTSPLWNGFRTEVWDYEFSTDATCVLSGEERIKCKHCNIEISRKVKAYGHSFGRWEVTCEPTVTTEGRWTKTCSVCAFEAYETIPTLIPIEQEIAISSNAGRQNYTSYAAPVRSYLTANSDGTITRVEALDDRITVERYSSAFAFLDRREIPMELPLFGGFYEGEEDFFFAFGQVNEAEDDSVEVVRIVRYSRDWLRKGSSSLYGANTRIPFRSGSLRMTQYEDMLYVHTCHQMYTSSDGLNHQANMIFAVYLPEMVITDQYTEVMNVSYGYVSHSFNQFVLTNGEKLLTLNHGDAYPRSAVIVEYPKPVGEKQFTGQCTSTSVLKFSGATGNNTTGASLGAFELSASAYLTAGNSILHTSNASLTGQRNIFLGVTPGGKIGSADSEIRWITDYEGNVKVSTPHLVKIHDDRFLLLWTEDGSLRYVFVDGNGIECSEIYRATMQLSDCKPILYQGDVCWYFTHNSRPLFCRIPLEQPDAPVMTELKVTVTLEANGGTLEQNTMDLVYWTPYGELPVPQRKSAYLFKGWYDSKYSSAKQVTPDTLVAKTEAHTLYARWEVQPHECEYELDQTIPANCNTPEIKIYTCIYCDDSNYYYGYEYAHTWDEGTVIVEPTCVKAGQTKYTCILCGVQRVDRLPAATGHSYTHAVTEPGCLERGYTTHICHCGYSYKDSYTDPLGHDWDEGQITTEPGCNTSGERTYTCRRCLNTMTGRIPATGHTYTSTVTEPTCEDYGYTTHTCHCGYGYTDSYTASLGHEWDEGVITIAPGCVTEGERTYTCFRCEKTETEQLYPTGHIYEAVGTEPTCEDYGFTTFICHCGESYVDLYLAPTGHCWDQGYIEVQPDCVTGGRIVYTCYWCGRTERESIPATGHLYSEQVIDPTCSEGGYTIYVCHCGHSFTDSYTDPVAHDYVNGICGLCGHIKSEEEEAKNPFEDIREGDYFYQPVLWALDKGITTGTSAVKFSPDAPCTRGQIVTFLWRACGSPEPKGKEHPFHDVATSAYYYKAVIWAVENGITTGTSANTFSPEKACTRGQVATFLWRSQGKPDPKNGSNPFADVDSSAYYYSAILWAVEEGITNGTGKGKFSPDAGCTRGQIVTFLYRALGEA